MTAAAHAVQLAATLEDVRLRVDRALERIAAGDAELALDLVSGACIQLHEARALARFAYEYDDAEPL